MNLLSELLHSRVVDVDGQSLGSVNDVRLVQDGPLLEGFGAALRVDGLVTWAGGLSIRLGYHRHRVRGPVLLKALFGALERRATSSRGIRSPIETARRCASGAAPTRSRA